jgi:hypothetical protein
MVTQRPQTQEGEGTSLGAGSTINYISQQWLSPSSYHIISGLLSFSNESKWFKILGDLYLG